MTNTDQPTPPRRELPLPGLAAICLYLLVIAGVIILGVAGGQHFPPVYLIFAVLFMAASAGLMLSFRWAWSLALGAMFLLAGYNLWLFTARHEFPFLAQGGLNLVFFLYLIRPEVRSKLR